MRWSRPLVTSACSSMSSGNDVARLMSMTTRLTLSVPLTVSAGTAAAPPTASGGPTTITYENSARLAAAALYSGTNVGADVEINIKSGSER